MTAKNKKRLEALEATYGAARNQLIRIVVGLDENGESKAEYYISEDGGPERRLSANQYAALPKPKRYGSHDLHIRLDDDEEFTGSVRIMPMQQEAAPDPAEVPAGP